MEPDVTTTAANSLVLWFWAAVRGNDFGSLVGPTSLVSNHLANADWLDCEYSLVSSAGPVTGPTSSSTGSAWTALGLVVSPGSVVPTTATLTGPASGLAGVASANFTITLDHPAQTGGVSCPITSSVGGDTVTTLPVVITVGNTTGTFTITPSATGSRNVTLGATTPSLTLAGTPIAYNATSSVTTYPAAVMMGL